jgi:N-acetylmuramoyl-L-alanine amidase
MGTLNLSSPPAVIVELGNMRNAWHAAHMKDDRYRDGVYAAGLARGIRSYRSR